MKPTTLDIKTEGQLSGETIDMTIDTNALAHLMTVLTDLYSDPALAVIREISTNAADANIDAGNTDPIQVSLPNSMNPYFVVKDQGVGLSVDEIRDVYSKYGASTKRNSNDVVGMLGLGCKAPLTYTEQFSVVGVKNGVRSSVAISRKSDGTGVMQVVDTSSTNEPNGVTVRVPVKDVSSFNAKAFNFFGYWKPGSVLINGKELPPFRGVWLTDDILLAEGAANDKIVMGNVNYPLSNRSLYNKSYGMQYHFVYYAKIGEVNFPPSREELMYTQLTLDTINRVKSLVAENIHKVYQDEIDNAKSHTEALLVYNKWASILSLNRRSFTYKGSEFYEYKDIDGPKYRSTGQSSSLNRDPVQLVRVSYFLNLYANDLKLSRQPAIILNFDLKRLSSIHKSKLMKYKEDKGLEFYDNNLYFFESDPTEVWLDGILRIDWNEVSKVKVATTPRVPRVPRPKVEKRYYTLQFNGDVSADVTESDVMGWKEVLYMVPSKYQWNYDHNREMRVLKGAYASCFGEEIIWLKESELEKFLKKFPKAINVETKLIEEFRKTQDSLTQDDQDSIGTRPWGMVDLGWLKNLDVSRLDDTELTRYIEDYDGQTATLRARKWKDMVKVVGQIKTTNRSSKHDEVDALVVKNFKGKAPVTPIDKYTLLRSVNYWDSGLNKDHVYTYMNAYYKEIS